MMSKPVKLTDLLTEVGGASIKRTIKKLHNVARELDKQLTDLSDMDNVPPGMIPSVEKLHGILVQLKKQSTRIR